MANIKAFFQIWFHMKLDRLLFYIFLVLLPFQTRILYFPGEAYVSWYFDYHLAFFVYLTDIILFVCFTTWVVFNKPIFTKIQQLLPLLGFGLVVLATLFHVKQMDLGLYQAVKWVELGMLFTYICTTFDSRKHITAILGILLVGSVFQAIIGWLQFHMQHMVGLTWLGEYIAPLGTPGVSNIETSAGNIIRAYGTMPHPNVLAAFLILGLVLGLYFVSRATTIGNKILLSLGVFVLTIGLFTTFSRIAWIAAAIAFISFFIFNWIKKQRSTLIVIVVVSLVSCATIAWLYSDSFQSRVGETSSVSVVDRYFFNQMGLDLIARYPILGVGVGNYVPALLDNYQLEPWQHQPPHNIFIFIAAELGIVGLGLFIWLLFMIIKNSWAKNIVSDPLLFTVYCLLITFLLMGQFDHYFVTIQQGRLMFAVVLGLVAALPNLNDKNSKI